MKVTLKDTYIAGTPAHTDKDGRPVKGSQKTHEPKSVIDLPKDEAERLIRLGAATAGGQAATAEPAAPVKPRGEALKAAIADAIGKLDRGEESEDFTAAGKPVVAALEKHLGYNISADDRDHAFEAYKAAHPDLFTPAAGG